MRATVALLMGCFVAGCLQPSRVSRSQELFWELFKTSSSVEEPKVTAGFTLASGVDRQVASRKIEKYLRENSESEKSDSFLSGRGEWACVLADLERLTFGFPGMTGTADLDIKINELLYAVKLKRRGAEALPVLIRTILDQEATVNARRLALEVLRDARDKRAIPALAIVAGKVGPIDVWEMDDWRIGLAFLAREALAHTIEPDAPTWNDYLYNDCGQRVETWYRTWQKGQPPDVPGGSGDARLN